jgi:RNA polymerase sigma factor (sigma-70 family)
VFNVQPPGDENKVMTPRSLLAPGRLAGQPVLRTQSDERLVDLVRAGSEPAFEAIVARYRRALLRYCSRILPEERAEDAVQQTFVRAYDSMLGSGAQLALKPWLYRIAHNTALNALRDRGLRHEALKDEIGGDQPDQVLERAQGLRAVLGAVQNLPERQRDAIVLREIEGRTYEEIAAELGVTGGAVRQLLNRARHSVRAAATAVTPIGLLERVPWSSPAQPLSERVAELCGAGGGALAAKACATALITGAVVGGVAVAPKEHEHAADAAPNTAAKRAPASAHAARTPAGASTRRSESGTTGSGDHSGRSRHGDGRGPDRHGHEDGDGNHGKGGGKSGSDGKDGHGDSGKQEELAERHGSGEHGLSGGGNSGSGSGSDPDKSGPGKGSDDAAEVEPPVITDMGDTGGSDDTALDGSGPDDSGSGGSGERGGGSDHTKTTESGSN